MKLNRAFIIIFVIVFGAIAGLIFLSLRLSDQQKARAISARSTENVFLTKTQLADKDPAAPTSIKPTDILLPEPSPSPMMTDPGIPPEAAEEMPLTITHTQTQQTGSSITYPVATVEPSISATPDPTSTTEAAQDPTPTQEYIYTPVEWTGNWTAFYGDEGGLLFRATLVVSRDSNTITGVHSTQIFTGTLSEDGQTVSGTWVNPPSTGTFSWTIVGENQFCGNTDRAFAYCGARGGASRPDPCLCQQPAQ
jgi:hypothetical protein